MKARYWTPLSKLQIRQLCTLAGQAYKLAKARGAVDDDMTAEEYRRQGQLEAAGVASLKEATQAHFLALRGKWFTVIGNLERAFYDFLQADPDNEHRRQVSWLLIGQVHQLAEGLSGKHETTAGAPLDPAEAARQAWAYTRSIAADRFHGRRLEALHTDELEQLGWTVHNRARTMQSPGSRLDRDKSQRARRGIKPPRATAEAGDGAEDGRRQSLFGHAAGSPVLQTSLPDVLAGFPRPMESPAE